MSKFVLSAALVALVLSFSVAPTAAARIAAGQPPVGLTVAAAQQSPVEVWNSICAAWEFPPVPATGGEINFMQAWKQVHNHELGFQAALAGITDEMNNIMGSVTDPTGDDTYNITIMFWGVGL